MGLRGKLIVVFLAATLAPLAVLVWLTTSLLEASLSYASTGELDVISRSLEATGREYYQKARESLKEDATEGKLVAQRFPGEDIANWPAQVQMFAGSKEPERFLLSGEVGDRLNYLVRKPNGDVWAYARKLGGPGMTRIREQFTKAREIVDRARVVDIRRGQQFILLGVAAIVYFVSLAFLLVFAFRITRPMRELEKGLAELAAGNLSVRLAPRSGHDEAAQTVAAFNRTAAQLEENREKLVQLTQIASFQTLARKTAHEVKNSLTPIRLVMEEMASRAGSPDPEFLKQASQIIVEEVATLERRVQAFRDFSSEPHPSLRALDINGLVEERVGLLRRSHPGVSWELDLQPDPLAALGDPDLLKGVLTNLLENAAQATADRGRVRARTEAAGDRAVIWVEDDGPGLSALARETLFAPAISFKKGGMGLGLSIAQRGTILSGGTIDHQQGELGGAAFRITLPLHQPVHAETVDS